MKIQDVPMEAEADEAPEWDRDDLTASIMDVLTKHHSSFEVSDIPMYLAKYRVDTLRAVLDVLDHYAAPDADHLTSKHRIRLIRAILNSGKERYVLTALKSMSFFILVAEASGPHTQLGWEDNHDPRMINRNMEKVYKETMFGSQDNEAMWNKHSHDADHHSSVLKAQHLANSIKLEAMFLMKMDYFIQVGALAQNIDRIEPALPVVVQAAKIVYGKSKTMPDGSGRRNLLDAESVIAIADACGADESKQHAIISMVKERGGFDRELLDMVANAASLPLADGIL